MTNDAGVLVTKTLETVATNQPDNFAKDCKMN